jgi:hypothetical protein
MSARFRRSSEAAGLPVLEVKELSQRFLSAIRGRDIERTPPDYIATIAAAAVFLLAAVGIASLVLLAVLVLG